jgi:hypothetical protein
MIRSIVLSKTYRQKTRKLPAKDPDNLYLSSMNRKRLNFEAMRDGMLQVSGELDLTMHGPSQKLHSKPYSKRRAVYGYIDRQNISPTLNSFDFANPNIHAPQRVETTVPQQALFAFNHPFVIERSATWQRKHLILELPIRPLRLNFFTVKFCRETQDKMKVNCQLNSSGPMQNLPILRILHKLYSFPMNSSSPTDAPFFT